MGEGKEGRGRLLPLCLTELYWWSRARVGGGMGEEERGEKERAVEEEGWRGGRGGGDSSRGSLCGFLLHTLCPTSMDFSALISPSLSSLTPVITLVRRPYCSSGSCIK